MTPNWKKKRPMMPPMKATGRNTATMQKVVASTARPISLVPSMAAWRCDLPKPMVAHDVLAHHDRVVDQDADREAQRHQGQHVQVKPKAAITMKAPNTEIGSASR